MRRQSPLQRSVLQRIRPIKVQVQVGLSIKDKSLYFTVVRQSFVKTVADRHVHAAYHNKR